MQLNRVSWRSWSELQGGAEGTDDLTVGKLWLLDMTGEFGEEGVGRKDSGRLIRNQTDPQNDHILLINTKQSSAGADGNVLLVISY